MKFTNKYIGYVLESSVFINARARHSPLPTPHSPLPTPSIPPLPHGSGNKAAQRRFFGMHAMLASAQVTRIGI